MEQFLPEKLISWADIAKSLGELVVDSVKGLLVQVKNEPPDYLSDHYRKPSEQPTLFDEV